MMHHTEQELLVAKTKTKDSFKPVVCSEEIERRVQLHDVGCEENVVTDLKQKPKREAER